jgi:hypothetical protein
MLLRTRIGGWISSSDLALAREAALAEYREENDIEVLQEVPKPLDIYVVHFYDCTASVLLENGYRCAGVLEEPRNMEDHKNDYLATLFSRIAASTRHELVCVHDFALVPHRGGLWGLTDEFALVPQQGLWNLTYDSEIFEPGDAPPVSHKPVTRLPGYALLSIEDASTERFRAVVDKLFLDPMATAVMTRDEALFVIRRRAFEEFFAGVPVMRQAAVDIGEIFGYLFTPDNSIAQKLARYALYRLEALHEDDAEVAQALQERMREASAKLLGRPYEKLPSPTLSEHDLAPLLAKYGRKQELPARVTLSRMLNQ